MCRRLGRGLCSYVFCGWGWVGRLLWMPLSVSSLVLGSLGLCMTVVILGYVLSVRSYTDLVQQLRTWTQTPKRSIDVTGRRSIPVKRIQQHRCSCSSTLRVCRV